MLQRDSLGKDSCSFQEPIGGIKQELANYGPLVKFAYRLFLYGL